MLRKKLRLSPSQDVSLNNGDNAIENECINKDVSKYFNNRDSIDVPTKLLEIAVSLNEKLGTLSFSQPVQYVYNPVEYAYAMHAAFVKKFCKTEKRILLLGLNPGPFGMVQTGIPFGEINMVKDWYKINEVINKPTIECPNRKIMGLDFHRSEISGKRLHEFFKNVSLTPEIFFLNTYLYNYCPLALMDKIGRNITPSSLKGTIKKQLEDYCSEALLQILDILKTEIIIALGVYTKKQAQLILQQKNIKNVQVICMPHPSPRAVGNENWGEKAQKVLEENDLLKYFKSTH